MPISGVVITSVPKNKEKVLQALAVISEVEVYGDDPKGNIVAVLETASSGEMERLMDRIGRLPDVLGVGLTYLNTEDEIENPAQVDVRGMVARPFGFRKPLDLDR